MAYGSVPEFDFGRDPEVSNWEGVQGGAMKIDSYGNPTLDSGTDILLNTAASGLSLTPDGELASGYGECDGYTTRRLTAAERLEIATFMVNEWLMWAAKTNK